MAFPRRWRGAGASARGVCTLYIRSRPGGTPQPPSAGSAAAASAGAGIVGQPALVDPLPRVAGRSARAIPRQLAVRTFPFPAQLDLHLVELAPAEPAIGLPAIPVGGPESLVGNLRRGVGTRGIVAAPVIVLDGGIDDLGDAFARRA